MCEWMDERMCEWVGRRQAYKSLTPLAGKGTQLEVLAKNALTRGLGVILLLGVIVLLGVVLLLGVILVLGVVVHPLSYSCTINPLTALPRLRVLLVMIPVGGTILNHD